jgi:hypothetical protein
MADKSATPEAPPEDTPATSPAAPPPPPKRSPGHRGADVKDTVAEMTAKAHEISLEAGSKMAAAMKDVINAAAGLTGFVVESARDLVQYMVRRGQMTQEEADKLIQRAEEAQATHAPKPESGAAKSSAADSAPKSAAKTAKAPAVSKSASAAPAAKKAAPAAKKAAPAAKKPTEKTSTAKKATTKRK